MAAISNLGFNFTIDSSKNHFPSRFNENDICAITYFTFQELMKSHFETCRSSISCHLIASSPYFVALVEDKMQCSALYDLKALSDWYRTKEWSEEAFRNPMSRGICQRVRIYGICKLGALPLGTVNSLSNFRKYFNEFHEESRLKDQFWWVMIKGFKLWKEVFNDYDFNEGLKPNTFGFSDEEILSWITLKFTHDTIYRWSSVLEFINRGDDERARNLLERIEKVSNPCCSVSNANLAQSYDRRRTYHLEKAAYYFKIAASLSPDYLEKPSFSIRYSNVLAKLSLSQGYQIDALEMLLKTKIHVEQQLTHSASRRLMEYFSLLGETYKLLGDFQSAIQYLTCSNTISLKRSSFRGYANATLHLIEIYRITKNFSDAHSLIKLMKSVPNTFVLSSDPNEDSFNIELERQEKLLAEAEEMFASSDSNFNTATTIVSSKRARVSRISVLDIPTILQGVSSYLSLSECGLLSRLSRSLKNKSEKFIWLPAAISMGLSRDEIKGHSSIKEAIVSDLREEIIAYGKFNIAANFCTDSPPYELFVSYGNRECSDYDRTARPLVQRDSADWIVREWRMCQSTISRIAHRHGNTVQHLTILGGDVESRYQSRDNFQTKVRLPKDLALNKTFHDINHIVLKNLFLLRPLPNWVFHSSKLQGLTFSNLNLNVIPPQVFDLTQLRFLSLSNIPLGTLPDRLANLINLEYLFINRIGLRDWPSSILKLHRLHRLQIKDNFICDIPQNVHEWLMNRKGLVLYSMGNPWSLKAQEILVSLGKVISVWNFYF